MTFYWHDWAGYIGVVLVLLAFLLLQAHKLHGNGLVYQLMNVLGRDWRDAVAAVWHLQLAGFHHAAGVVGDRHFRHRARHACAARGA